MAYHNRNYLKKLEAIRAVYSEVKEEDKPDSFIVHKIFPKHGINISYRGWMFMKHYDKPEPSPNNQLDMFAQLSA